MKISWKTCFRICLSVFLLYLAMTYWQPAINLIKTLLGAASPLIIGFVIAYLVNILMSFYERHYFPKSTKPFAVKSRRGVCMISAFLTLVLIVVLVISIIVPQLVLCFKLIISELPGVMSMLVEKLGELNIVPENIFAALSTIDWQSRVGEIFKVLTTGVGSVMDIVIGTVSAVFSGIVTAFLSLIFSFYLLASKDKLGSQASRVVKRYIPSNVIDKIKYVTLTVDDCFHDYIVGQCTEAVILGGLCTLGMLIFRLPYAPMIGALIAFTALIPIAGAYIGAGIGAFMILTVSPIQALGFLVFILVLQQLEGNLIYPRVVGSSLGLPGIWVLAAVTVGGGVMGIFGMLLAVPIVAAIYRILGDDLDKDDEEPAVLIEEVKSIDDVNKAEK